MTMKEMHPKISLTEAKTLIKNQWKNRTYKQKPLFLEGARGVGKTQSIKQVAEELSEETRKKVQFKTVILSVLEAPDLNGMPYIKDGVTEYGRPHFLPDSGHGILFFDEANRANRDIQNALLTLIEDRSINGHKLGDGWVIVLAGNPVNQGGTGPKYDTRQFDDALKDRLSFYTMDTRDHEVVNYLRNKYGQSNPVVTWLTLEPGMICLDGTRQTSPRSLEYLINAFKVHENVSNYTVAAGVIGMDAAVSYTQFLQNPHILTIKHLWNLTPEVRSVIEKTQDDPVFVATLQYWNELVCTELKKKMKDEKSEFLDFEKMPDCLRAVSEYMSTITNASWQSSFVTSLGELFDREEENVYKQLRAIRKFNNKVGVNLSKAGLKEAKAK